VTPAQIALASLDAFVIMASASVTGNLLAGWISRWWAARRDETAATEWLLARGNLGVAGGPILGGRCEHLRVRELCDDCNSQASRE
jgi:hypothetical protein